MEFIIILLLIAASAYVLYLIIKTAVRDGIIEARQQKYARNDSSGLPQTTCPECGSKFDFDYPECPSCGRRIT